MKKFTKVLAVLVLALSSMSPLFAKDKDLYASAPKEVRERIAAADKYIADKQYASANGALGLDDNEYIILKRTDLYTRYFVMSMMHQMFALKNLKPEEDLMELRRQVSYGSQDMDFAMTMYNPVEVITSYAEEHGMSPILNLALGHYYFDTLIRYGDNWLENVNEMVKKANTNFAAAYEAGVYNKTYLDEYGELLINISDAVTACEVFAKSVSLVSNDPRTWFNYAVSALYANKLDTAVTAAKNAIKYKDPDPDFDLDAYLLLVDVYRQKKDNTNATKTIQQARKAYPDAALPLLYEGHDYNINGNVTKATECFVKAYQIDSSDDTLKRAIDSYHIYGQIDAGIEFCKTCIEFQAENPNPRSMLYYMMFQLYLIKGDKESAEDAITKAEESLAEATDASYARRTFKDVRASFDF